MLLKIKLDNIICSFGRSLFFIFLSPVSLKSKGNIQSRENNIIQPQVMISSVDNISSYHMASSASGQDEPNRALWLATRAGKMEPSCPLGTTRCIPHEKCPRKPYNKSFIDQVCAVKMVGYWPRSFFASLWTSTSSRSINTQKKNLANIQPSWPHTWSITHTDWRKFGNVSSSVLFSKVAYQRKRW